MVFPNDLNSNDTVFGGMIMAQMHRFAAVVADRHAGGGCVTASVDAVHFIAPARRGDVLIFNARSDEHTYDLKSLLRTPYAVCWLQKRNNTITNTSTNEIFT